jgi:hypothetical protein
VNSVLLGPTRSEGAVDFLGKVAAEHNTDIAAVEEEFIRTMRPTSLIRRFAESEESQTWWCFSAAKGPRQLPALHCEPMAAWCAASPEATRCLALRKSKAR